MCAKIVLQGFGKLSPVAKSMGAYKLQQRRLNNKPVYILYNLEGLSYLYYVRGLWVVGPKVGGLEFDLAVTSKAVRPDKVNGAWSYFVAGSPKLAPKVRCICIAATPAPTPDPALVPPTTA